MKIYPILCSVFCILGFIESLIFDPSTMSGEQLIARTIMSAGAAISCAILAHANKNK